MFGFAHIRIEKEGSNDFCQGTLFRLTAELCSKQRLASCARLTQPGWHSVEFGYQTYVTFDSGGIKYIFPFLYLSDAARPTKRYPDHKPLVE